MFNWQSVQYTKYISSGYTDNDYVFFNSIVLNGKQGVSQMTLLLISYKSLSVRERTGRKLHRKKFDAWICRGVRRSIWRRTERDGKTASPDVQTCTRRTKY